MTKDQDQVILPHKTAHDIVVRFNVVFKIAKFYEPNNANFVEQLKILKAILEEPLAIQNEVILQVSQSAIFVNHLRVKFDYASYYIYKSVLAEFLDRGMGTLTFLKGLGEDELGRFMVLLARQDARSGSGDPFERLEESTRIKGFPHIALERATDADRPGEKELRAARTYFLGIAHVKEIFEKQRDVFKFNVTKRWIQSIFNHISNDESFVYGLTNIKNHDEYTLNHSVNVAVLSVALGRRLGLSRRELAELGVSAFLHDLGKLDIPKEILEKPSGLDSQEWAVMERHSHLGAERIIQIKAERGIPNRAVQVAFEHHLKADLSGYPKFHRKRQLNFYSKIVKITDYFDAMTTTRVYRPRAYTREEALDIMLHLSGEEFDTLILKAFANMIGSHPVGSLVALDTGEIGIVFGLNDQAAFAQRPRVKLIADAGGKKFDGPEVELTETVPDGAVFKRTIVKTLDPEKYGLKIADYFLARVS